MSQTLRRMFGLPYKLPPVTTENTAFTQDICKLEMYQFQNVFIYNEMMKGCSRFDEVMKDNCVYLGSGFTREDNFILFRGNEQSFAVPITDEHMHGNSTLFGTLPAKLMGHVYTMRPDQIVKLDNCLQNGVMFVRKRIKIEVPYIKRGQINERLQYDTGDFTIDGKKYVAAEVNPPERRVHVVPTWAYIGNMPYWSTQMDGAGKRFSPANKFKNRSGEPYFYYAEKIQQGCFR